MKPRVAYIAVRSNFSIEFVREGIVLGMSMSSLLRGLRLLGN